jgi:hypothetical protein
VTQLVCDFVARFAGRKMNINMASNERRWHAPNQIIRKPTEGNKLLAGGTEFDGGPGPCRSLGHQWPPRSCHKRADYAPAMSFKDAQERARARNQAVSIFGDLVAAALDTAVEAGRVLYNGTFCCASCDTPIVKGKNVNFCQVCGVQLG